MTRPRSVPNDAHLPLIGYREIDAGKIELARALFAVGEADNRTAMEVLETMREVKPADEPLPYLAVREDPAQDGTVRRVIVVRQNLAQGRVEKSTEIDAGDLTTEDLKNPENHPPAAATALDEYAADRLFRKQVADAPRDIRVSTVVLMYVKLRDPENMSPGAKALREYEARLEGETSPWTGFVNATNFAKQLIRYLKDMRVGEITANLGQNYKDDVQSKPRLRGGTDAEGQTVAVPSDWTVDHHLSLLSVALKWFAREYRPAVRLDFDKPKVKRGDRICLTWEEVRRAIMFCLGYVWDGTGYVTESVFRDGKWCLVLVRRPLAEYEMYLPVVRFLLVYFLTGTRFKAILKLGWVPLNFRGWIDLDRGWIYRNGRKSKQHFAKPKEQSQLLPVVRKVFANWFADDERLGLANKWTIRPSRRRKGARGVTGMEEKGHFVVHDGSGNPIPLKRMQNLITEVFAKVGIDATGHKLKGGGVTTYHDAGFSLAQISFWFGTTERVLDTSYRKLKAAEATYGIRPAPPDPSTITLSQLLDPHGRLGPIPRSASGAENVLDALAAKAGARRARPKTSA